MVSLNFVGQLLDRIPSTRFGRPCHWFCQHLERSPSCKLFCRVPPSPFNMFHRPPQRSNLDSNTQKHVPSGKRQGHSLLQADSFQTSRSLLETAREHLSVLVGRRRGPGIGNRAQLTLCEHIKSKNGPRRMLKALHPGRLTWSLKMNIWKTIFLYNPVVFTFHVNLQRSIPNICRVVR